MGLVEEASRDLVELLALETNAEYEFEMDSCPQLMSLGQKTLLVRRSLGGHFKGRFMGC